MCATDTPLGIALRNIRIHSASFECIKWFSIEFNFNSSVMLGNYLQQTTFPDAFFLDALKAGVGYIRQNNLQFHHFLHCTQAVNIYRSLSLIWLASGFYLDYSWQVLSAQSTMLFISLSKPLVQFYQTVVKLRLLIVSYWSHFPATGYRVPAFKG